MKVVIYGKNLKGAKMSVHKKLMEARIRLQNTQLKKSGQNKFAGYEYFELGDFLPQIQQIFSDIGLCGVISFSKDEAILAISDNDTDTNVAIAFRCPMAQASLKGCHEVQNLGASMTYIRRYLWVNALEIVEHDALDATTGKDKPSEKEAKTRLPTLTFEQAEKEFNSWTDEKLNFIDKEGEVDNNALTDAWGKKLSNVRTAIKKYGNNEYEEQQQEISPEAKQHLDSF